MSSKLVINVQNVSKLFQIYERPEDRLKQFIYPHIQKTFGLKPKHYHSEFWALKDISFKVEKGETVGIIGHNGAGKSTLLQIICGTLAPTNGYVETNGVIGALLELGSGFNHDFSGRENVYINAAILGLSTSDVRDRFDDIVNFAGIGDFIDQPVKTYSSGMLVRLAFAVQAQTQPDILIVDEALAVGDAKFQAKCFDRIKQLKENGTSILLVTHSGEQIVTHCDRAILLDRGQCIFEGEPKSAVNIYMDLLFGSRLKDDNTNLGATADIVVDSKSIKLSVDKDIFFERPRYNHNEYRWGDGLAQWLDFQFCSNNKLYPHVVYQNEEIILKASAKISKSLTNPIIGFAIKTKEGITLYNTNSELQKKDLIFLDNTTDKIIVSTFQFINRLGPGDYFISIGIASRHEESVVPHDRRYDVIHFMVPKVDQYSGLFDLNVTIENDSV